MSHLARSIPISTVPVEARRDADTEPLPRSELGPPIFVVGYMHSGTTLLLRLLANHPDVYVGAGETKFFERLPWIRRRFRTLAEPNLREQFLGWTSNVIKHGFNSAQHPDSPVGEAALGGQWWDAALHAIDGVSDHGHVFRVAYEHLAMQQGKTRCLEKTPTHVFHVADILSCMPNAQFVHIVRDGRDVLASKKTRRSTVWTTDRYSAAERPRKHLEKAYHPVWDSLSWKSAVRAGEWAARVFPDQVHTLRYEDLVSNPFDRIKDCCDFLGLSYSDSLVEVDLLNPADHTQKHSGISSASVGRWKSILDPAEVVVCQRIAGAELTRHQYPLQLHNRRTAFTAAPYFLTSVGEFSRRLFRKWRLGGSRYTVNVLANYWKQRRALTQSRR